MGFVGPLGKLFRESFSTAGAAAAPVSWWLSGGIAAANCPAAYQPKGAASLAASYDNKAAPGNGLPDGTYDAAPGTAPTWDIINGWYFNSALFQWLTTGIRPAQNQTWSMVIRYSGADLTGTRGIIGTYRNGNTDAVAVFATGVSCYNGKGFPNQALNAPSLAGGVYAIAGRTPHRNGIAEANLVPVGNGTTGMYNILIGAVSYNSDILPNYYYLGYVQAAAIYNVTVTTPQIAAVSAAMAAL